MADRKQFFWVDAYPGEVYVLKFINGRRIDEELVTHYKLPKYIDQLYIEGYELAKYIPYHQHECDKALEQLKAAKKHYRFTKEMLKFYKKRKLPLLILDDDIEKQTLDSFLY